MLTEEKPGMQPPSPATEQSLLRRYAWWIVAVALIAASAGIVRWAGTRPGYDPYGWMIWGYQALHGSLNLGGAPSWKPMPLLFTAPFALFGNNAQLWLWMTTAVAMSFAGCIFAGRIAFRVVDEGGRHRWPAIASAVFAAVMLLVIFDSTHYSYLHYILSVQSDPPLVSCVLAAIDMHLIGRRRWAVAALTLASLGRPEAWPALVLYALWCLRKDPEMLRFLIICGVIILVMWFGIPTITNHKPLIAGDLAADSPRMLHSNKIIGTIGRFKALNQWPVWLCAGIGTAWAAFRLRRKDPDPSGHNTIILVLFANCMLWVFVEIIFSLKGLPGVPRYMFEPAAVSIVIAAIAFGWLLSEIPRFFKVPWVVGLLVIAGITGAIVPGALARARNEHKELRGERVRATELSALAGIIHASGGVTHLEQCGTPVMGSDQYASVLGWLMHLNTGQIGYKVQAELHMRTPIVLLTPLPNGWAAWAWHTKPSMRAQCARSMDILFVGTPSHPDGVLTANHTPPVETALRPKKKHT
jgi:hypothetical protein